MDSSCFRDDFISWIKSENQNQKTGKNVTNPIAKQFLISSSKLALHERYKWFPVDFDTEIQASKTIRLHLKLIELVGDS